MKTLFAAGAMLVISTAASAAPVCASGTLTSFLALSGGCMIGSNTVSAFSTSFPKQTGATLISPNIINVTSNNSSTAPALTFTTSVTATNMLDEALIGYRISGNLYTGDSISLTGTSTTGSGFASDIQNYCLGGTISTTLPFTCSAGSSNFGTLSVPGNTSVTFSAVSSISVLHDFTLDGAGGAAGNGSASGGVITDQYTANVQASGVPEPASLVLLASGLALGAIARRFARKGDAA